MKKIFIVLLLSVILIAGVFAQAEGETATKDQTIVLRLADNQPDNYPTVIGDKKFAELVEKYSNGRIKVDVYSQAQLGDEKSCIEQVQFGGIDFTRVSISPLSSFNPHLNALQMPYLYRDPDHLWKVLNGEIGQYFLDSMKASNFIGLTYYDSGARSFYTTKKPIYTVSDLKGLKIRVQESDLMMGLVSSLGAVPTPMSYGDVYSSLQSGVIDGAENNWPSYDSSSHYEVAKYYSIDQHTRVPEMLIASKISMDKLSAEDVALIKKAAKDSQQVQIDSWADYAMKSEAKVREAGCKINKINDQAEFAAAMAPLYDSMLSDEDMAWVEKIRAVK
ncbi:MAG: TRAP transporter substrate-binding protein [Sphaerochaetaceae bacterium]